MYAKLTSPITSFRSGLVPDATLVRRIALATVAAGALDAVFAVIFYVVVVGRYNLETVLQYIATGLLGHHAFRGGGAGVGTAALGAVTHLALAAGFATAFALTIGRLLRTRSRAVIAGVIYPIAHATGAFINRDPVHLQSTGFVPGPGGRVIGVYSSGAIGTPGPRGRHRHDPLPA